MQTLHLLWSRVANDAEDAPVRRREWRLILELVGIGVMAFLLLQIGISQELPAEMFIYGRF